MANEVVYTGYDNSIDFLILSDGVPVDLGNLTQVDLLLEGEETYTSTNQDGDPVLWGQADYGTGELRIFLGGEAVPAGSYTAYLILYDATATNGIVWDSFTLTVTTISDD